MLAQPKLLSWSATKSRIHNQLQYGIKARVENSHRIASSLLSHVPQFPLFECRTFAKYQFDTQLQTFAYYRSVDEDDDVNQAEDILIVSLLYDDPRGPRSAVFVYFTSLNTGTIRRCIKHDFQFPSFQLLKYIPKLKIVVGISNERLYLLSNKNGHLKYLTSVNCSGTVRRIIYDKTTRDFIYLGGDKGLFVRWNLIREKNGYELRSGDRMKSIFINRQQNIIDMKMDPITHKLFVVGHKGCLIFDTLLNRESACVLSAHNASVTCANVYGYSIVMGFEDGLLKIFEIGTESIPVRYQFQAHQAAIISMLITADGVIITGAQDGTVCFHSLDTLLKLGEYRFHAAIERMMFVRGEDILVKFHNDLQLLTFILPIRHFSSALQPIESARVTFPVGSIPSRVVTQSTQNLFTIYNPRSTQILNTIPLSPDRITIQDFVYDTAAEILYIVTSKTVCSYHCGTKPAYLLNIFEVKEDCFFTKLACLMWFSLLPEHTRKRRAFGVVFVGTTNGKLYLVPGDHGLKYALLPDTPSALYSFHQILSESTSVECLGIFQAYETYTTRNGGRYLMAFGNDFVAKIYRLSISGHEIYLRKLGVSIFLDAACIGTAMADNRLAIACAGRGYIRMYAVTTNGLDEISPKDILHEHSPIKSITGCESSGLFASLNNLNEIMLWTRNNEVIRKIRSDVSLICIGNLNDRGDILLVASRRLYFLMISDFAPDEILSDLTKKQIKDDPIEFPVQINKKFDTSVLKSAQTVQLDERAHPKISTNLNDSGETLGFFEALEQERIQREMSKILEQKQNYPVAPDALIPNSTLRSMFKMKPIEPAEAKMFRLRLDILENLQSQGNKNLQWQNDDDEWVEIDDPDAVHDDGTTRTPQRQRSSRSRPVTGNMFSRTTDTMPEIFRRLKKEPWFDLPNTDENNDLRSMLLYLIDLIRQKQSQSYEKACDYLVEIFRLYGIEPSLIDELLKIFIEHLNTNQDDPLDVFTVRAMAQFMIERKDVVVGLLEYAVKCQPTDILRYETINAVKYITDVNSSEDIDLALENIPIVRDAADDTFSLKMIIERIKVQRKPIVSQQDGGEETDEQTGDRLHPLLEKISKERWYPRDHSPITLDSVIDAILSKLPNASKTMLKTLTSYLVQLNRQIGFSDEQFDRVAKALLTLLTHSDADYRLIAATIFAELGKETKDIDLALLNSFINDARILVRTECCDTLKKLTGVTSDTVLKDCAEDLPILRDLPAEGFTLQNYLDAKNRVPTPPPPGETVTTEGETQGEEDAEHVHLTKDQFDEEDEMQQRDEEEDERDDRDEDERAERDNDDDEDDQTREEYPSMINDDQQRYLDEQSKSMIIPTTEGRKSMVRFRTPSPNDEKRHSRASEIASGKEPTHVSGTTSVSSATNVTPVQPPIRVEFNDKNRPSAQNRQSLPRNRREGTLPSFSSNRATRQTTMASDPTTNRSTRQTIMPFDPADRSPNRLTVPEPTHGRRTGLLPNNPKFWDVIEKQNELNEQRRKEEASQNRFYPEVIDGSYVDPIDTMLDHHQRDNGIFRPRRDRPTLVPHKISLGDVFGDQTHLTINRKFPSRPLSRSSPVSDSMQLSDLNQNRSHLRDVESVQLLSSLVVRSIQVHRKYVPFVPGSLTLDSDSASSFADALTISQMQLHSSSLLTGFGHRLPPINRPRPSSAETTRLSNEATARGARAGVNVRRAQDMEDVLSNLLHTDRQSRQMTTLHNNTPLPPRVPAEAEEQGVTHAWLLEQLLRSQGKPTSRHHIQKILRAYPKFTPLLNSRVPSNLIPMIWNDPVIKQLASIISKAPDETTTTTTTTTNAPIITTTQAFEEPNRQTQSKSTLPTFDEEHSSNFFDYTAPAHLTALHHQQREDHQKKHLPPVRSSRLPLPRHVLRFGFRELELDSPEASIESLRDEHVSKARRRRIYMHLMCNHHLCHRR